MTTVVVGGAVLLVLLVSAAAYMGAFHPVTIEEREVGPFMFVYREVPGTRMDRIGQVTDEVDAVLEARGITNRRPLNVFYPDGRPTQVGFAVEGSGPDEAEASALGVQVRELPRQRCLVTEFPWRNPLSFVVGYFKVDPALAVHRQEHAYEKAEALALNEGRRIRYMQPVRAESPERR